MAGSPTVAEMFTHMHHERMVSVLENVPESARSGPGTKSGFTSPMSERIAAMLTGQRSHRCVTRSSLESMPAVPWTRTLRTRFSCCSS